MGEQTDWTPAFPGQRPPLTAEQWAEPGNTRALVHGAYSATQVEELAGEIEQRARSLESWPVYLDEPTYATAVRAWARTEAVVEKLWRWLVDQDIDTWMAEVTETSGSEDVQGGRVTRRSTTRRVGAVLDQLRQWESRAAGHRARLGLDPLSRARLGKDVAATQLDVAQYLTAQREAAERSAKQSQEATDDQ